MKLKERAEKIKREIPAIFLSLKSKDTPLIAKIFAAVTVAYALSPIDLIPDFIPVLGYIDDLIILPIVAVITIKLIPEKVFSECLSESEQMWKNDKPKKWYFAIPIIVFWLLILWIIIRYFFL